MGDRAGHAAHAGNEDREPQQDDLGDAVERRALPRRGVGQVGLEPTT
ncbi:hypothetical protein LWC35_11880 [Pseudonocardia kujensis]|nr:hypothetical protein [Pseudonocardia kujensis]MCE0763598.1 hypothetical protein [Pseudonocardia kujensis]